MKKNQIILIIIGVLILVGLVFSYRLQFIKPKVEIDPCREFPEIVGEVSCQEAIQFALEKYPGEIENISKEEIILRENAPSPAFWLVEITLKKPLFFEKINKKIRTIKIKITMDKNVDIYELVE